MTNSFVTWGAVSRTRTTRGTATLYGRLETSDHGPPAGSASSSQSVLERVGLEHPDPDRLGLLPQRRKQMPVDLDGGDRGTHVGQRQGERAQAGADLDHAVPGADSGQANHPADGVGVGHEVLSESPARLEMMGLEQPMHVGPAVGHPLSVASLGRGEVDQGAGERNGRLRERRRRARWPSTARPARWSGAP